MKKITERTKLVQGHKIYQAIKLDGIIYWVDNNSIGSKFVLTRYYNDAPYSLYKISQEVFDACTEQEPNGGVHGFVGNKLFEEDSWKNGYFIEGDSSFKIISQSEPKLEGIPVISLEANNTKLIMEGECPLDLNSYSLEDIKRCIKLSREIEEVELNVNEIIEQLNCIQEIEVDNEFNIIRFL